MTNATDPKLAAIQRFFAAYAARDLDAIATVLAHDVEWTIPGHHPLCGTKNGIEEVLSFFDQLGKVGFQADTIFLEASTSSTSTAVGQPKVSDRSTPPGHSYGTSAPTAKSIG